MIRKSIFPNLIFVIIASLFVYYSQLLTLRELVGDYLIYLAIGALVLGYILGNYVKVFKLSKRKTREISYKKLLKIGKIFVILGLISHLIFYISFGTTSSGGYADSYLSTRGFGFITVFFDFIILGTIIIFSVDQELNLKNSSKIKLYFLLSIYCFFYLFILLKRRQLIFLLIVIIYFTFKDTSFKSKAKFYFIITLLYMFLMIFGRVRFYTSNYGFDGLFSFIKSNFEFSWLALQNTEGRYISRTHSDVFLFVKEFGTTLTTFIGSIFTLVPRKLLPFAKPNSFPNWYTFTFYPEVFLIGGGFAGSFVIEQYLIGKEVGVFVVFLLLGFTIKRFNKGWENGNKTYSILYPVILYTLIFLPRLDWGSLIVILIFNILPVCLAIKLSLKTK